MADLQRIDMEIGMCHFDLSTEERSLKGKWELRDPELKPLPERTEYIVTWIGE
jgi:hypothetical protein